MGTSAAVPTPRRPCRRRCHRPCATAAGITAARLIVVMEAAQRDEIVRRFGRRPEDVLILGDLDPESIDTRTIRDPVEQPLDVFESTYGRIDRCISQLVRTWSA